MTPEIKQLTLDYQSVTTSFILVFPNFNISNDSTVRQFMTKYQLNLPFIVDSNQVITKQLGASITPEAIVVSRITDEVVYRGCLTDEFIRVGQRKRTNINRVLNQFIKNMVENNNIDNFECQPIGCYIVKP